MKKKPYHSPKLTHLDPQTILPEMEAAAKAGDVAAQKMLAHPAKGKTSDERVLNPISV
jgi:hypothetical protein